MFWPHPIVVLALTISTLRGDEPAVIWSDQPALNYAAGLPLGNGRLGAMVLGRPDHTRFALTHAGLHQSNQRVRDTSAALPNSRGVASEPAKRHQPENRSLLEQLQAAARPEPGACLPFANVFVDFPEHKTVANYRRELDLASAIAKVSYDVAGTRYTHTAVTPLFEPLLLVTLTSDKPGQLSGIARLARHADPQCTILYDSPRRGGLAEFGFSGRFENGSRLAARARAAVQGGKWEPFSDPVQGAGMRFEKADRITLWITLEAQSGSNAHDVLSTRLRNVEQGGAALLQNHLQTQRRLFERCTLTLAGWNRSAVPLERRLKELASGQADPGLEALLFQFGRYLAIARSAPAAEAPKGRPCLWNNSLYTGKSTGEWTRWFRIWALCVCALFGEGDRAEAMLRGLLVKDTGGNLLWVTSHRHIWPDGNLLFTAAIREMLLQEKNGRLFPLPALPASWPEGSVRGLAAADSMEADLRWQKGKLTEMVLRSPAEREVRIKLPEWMAKLKGLANGKPQPVTVNDGVATIRVVTGITRIVVE